METMQEHLNNDMETIKNNSTIKKDIDQIHNFGRNTGDLKNSK